MWPFAPKHHAMATNMTVSASALDGLSPYEGHMKEPFAGMMIPFGASSTVPRSPSRHAPQVRAPVMPWDLPRMIHATWHGVQGRLLRPPMNGLDTSAGQIPAHRIKEVRMAHPTSFPLQKLENTPLIQVEAAIESARDDDLAALANDREVARKKSRWTTSTTCSALRGGRAMNHQRSSSAMGMRKST